VAPIADECFATKGIARLVVHRVIAMATLHSSADAAAARSLCHGCDHPARNGPCEHFGDNGLAIGSQTRASGLPRGQPPGPRRPVQAPEAVASTLELADAKLARLVGVEESRAEPLRGTP
jgi:hypothetical protein